MGFHLRHLQLMECNIEVHMLEVQDQCVAWRRWLGIGIAKYDLRAVCWRRLNSTLLQSTKSVSSP